METMVPLHPSSPGSPPLRRLKRVEYEKLATEGCFDRERVELVFGMVVAMPPIDPAHGESVDRLDAMLRRQLTDRARVRCQGAFAATEDSEPQPDLYVFPIGDYWSVQPDRAYLVIEVARSSLDYDRETKSALYGVSQVDEYWIVNHVEGVVEVYRDRRDGRWRTMTTHDRGETIALVAFPDVKIPVAEILPPRMT
jgi:Uma2 family endonuclease